MTTPPKSKRGSRYSIQRPDSAASSMSSGRLPDISPPPMGVVRTRAIANAEHVAAFFAHAGDFGFREENFGGDTTVFGQFSSILWSRYANLIEAGRQVIEVCLGGAVRVTSSESLLRFREGLIQPAHVYIVSGIDMTDDLREKVSQYLTILVRQLAQDPTDTSQLSLLDEPTDPRIAEVCTPIADNFVLSNRGRPLPASVRIFVGPAKIAEVPAKIRRSMILSAPAADELLLTGVFDGARYSEREIYLCGSKDSGKMLKYEISYDERKFQLDIHAAEKMRKPELVVRVKQITEAGKVRYELISIEQISHYFIEDCVD